MIPRQAAEKARQLANQFKALALMGPRQSGKTTLVRNCFPAKPYVSLENPVNRQFALEDPLQFLRQYPDGAILDEVQRTPALLSWLQQNLDEDVRKGKFILTGSNNLLLLEKITQTLAGRVAYLELLPFSVAELQALPAALNDLNDLLWRGAYPPIQADGIPPSDWFAAYIRTYVEWDVRQVKNIDQLLLFEKMLALCAGRVGQQINYANLAVETGVDSKTVQSWMGVLQASYIIFLLPPFYQNFNKRVVKAPKLYFYDTGLACHLLRISDPAMLIQHPYRGALFENFITLELLKNRFNRGQRSNLYYWRENSGREIDLLLDEGLRQWPVEIKSGETITSDWLHGLRYWAEMTGQPGGTVYYAGNDEQHRSNDITVKNWRSVGD
ncbi:MAG: ATP-binding protein [Saprospiraceae bacterium]